MRGELWIRCAAVNACEMAFVALLVFAATMTSAISAGTKGAKPTAGEILSKARNAVSLRQAVPFEMRADVKFREPRQTLKGTYLLDWAAPAKFREEIHLPGFDEVKIASGAMLYVKRSLDYTPLDAFRLEELMNPGATLREFQREASVPANPAKSQNPGLKVLQGVLRVGYAIQDCLYSSGFFVAQVCVDSQRDLPREVWLHHTADDEMIAYGKYKSAGSGFLPREAQYLSNGDPVIKVDVKRVVRVASFPLTTFAPPAGAERVTWCTDEVPPERLAFHSPLPVTASDLAGSEILDVFVRATGMPSRLQIIGTAGTGADAAAGKLANLILFKPATCNGKAVAAETPVVLGAFDVVPVVTPTFVGGKNVPEAEENGYTAPKCLSCPTPPYSSLAFQNKVEGPLILDLVVGTDGRAHQLRVAGHVGWGLDAEGLETVRDQWRFRPALGPDGKPAAVKMLIEIDFSLY